MNGCMTCKLRITNECEFGEAVNTIRGFSDDDNNKGFNAVLNILEESIEQYIDCEYYESR